MKIIYILTAITFLNTLSLLAQNKKNMEETEIENLIKDGYLNGALNKMDTPKMRDVYHKDFAIFYNEGEELKRLPLEDWIKMVNNYKKSKDTSGLRDFDYEFVQIDVTENASFVKLKLMRKGVLIFTDYITLLKFENSWKIVTKIYNAHVQNPWKL